MRFEEAPRLTQRLKFIEEAKRQFWKKWMQQVFSGRMLNQKWTKNVRNVAIGDIVYLAEAENDDPTYRLGQIVEACPGEDGCVRTVRVQYTNPGKPEGKRSPPKTTTRPIHKVAMVVPVEYVFEDDTCDNVIGSRCPRRVLKTKEEVEAAEALRKGSTKVRGEVPKTGGAQPAIRKRRGRPKKSERPATIGDGPQTEKQEVAEAAVEAEVLQEAGNQLPAVRRGRSRDLGPRGQQDRGRNC
jgi:hypothetical protein